MAIAPVRIGIIGCGAVTSVCHLPAARAVREAAVVALADTNQERAAFLARRFGVGTITQDYRRLVGAIDGAIVALPHALHAPVATELLRAGVPVLVEKPLATTTEEALQLVTVARETGVPLQAGYMFRYSRAARLVKRILEEGWLGTIQGFSLESGGIYSWPIASGFFWQKAQAGGGVLIDTGSHMLDLLLWWLGDVVDLEYRDDNLGGVEADCWMALALRGPAGVVRGEVTMSRLRRLRSAARIVGSAFTLECGLSGRYPVRVWPTAWQGDGVSFVGEYEGGATDSFERMFVEQLREFARVVRERTPPAVSGESVLGVIALIERCYRERRPLEQPWLHPVKVPS
jgi:predicted dehydrogenase